MSSTSSSPDPAGARDPRVREALRRHRRRTVMLQVVLLVTWAVAGLGCGVLFADVLQDAWPGKYLGFWFAQQGSILVFVVLVLIHALVMNCLDVAHQRAIAGHAAEQAAS